MSKFNRARMVPLPNKVISAITSVGFSRHTAVPALRRLETSSAGTFARRSVSLVLGSSFIGVALGLLVQADLGLPPYDVLSSAISSRAGLTLGQAGWAMAAFFFVVAALFGRRPSPWGIVYIFANGLAVDAASGLLTQPDTLPGRWLFVLSSVVVLASGVSLVVYSGTTGGPFELLMRAGEDRGISPTAVRYSLDLGVFGLGVALGGSFGPATIAFAITFGLVLRVIGQALVDHGTGRQARRDSDADVPAKAKQKAKPRKHRQPVG